MQICFKSRSSDLCGRLYCKYIRNAKNICYDSTFYKNVIAKKVMKKLLITLFIIQVVFSTLLYFYGVFDFDFGPIVVSWVVFGTFCLIVFYISKGFSLGFGSLSNSYFGRNKKRKLISKQDEDDAYQLVSDEVRNNAVNDAIWTKLYIKHKGDKKKTEIDYLKERVNQIPYS